MCLPCIKIFGRVMKTPLASFSLLLHLSVHSTSSVLCWGCVWKCASSHDSAAAQDCAKSCQLRPCWWQSPWRCVCSCCLGSEISWLPGRSGLAGSPASALSQESGMGHAAWGSHEGSESTGAVGWQPRQLPAAHPQHRVLWLEALAMCPTVCCAIFLHYTHPRLGCG